MAWHRRVLAALAALSSLGGVFAASLTWSESATGSDSVHPFAEFPTVVKPRQENGPNLRILPLGASIMSGVGSPEHSGFVIIPGVLQGGRELTRI